MSERKYGKAKTIVAKLVLILFGIFLGVSIAEIALRIAGYSYPDFFMLDEARGYALRPGMEGWFRKEGESYVRINSDGLRDRQHTKAKPENTLRIAVLGDSYAEALQVPMEQAFWAVMEGEVRGCGLFAGKEIEVLNFGVSGYGTAQELITLRDHVWDYSPDIVLLAVTTSNDITDNSLQLRRRVQAPYFFYRDGVLILDESFKNSKGFNLRQSIIGRAGDWLSNHLRVVQAVQESLRGLRILFLSWRSQSENHFQPPQWPSTRKADIVAKSVELGTDNVVYLEPVNPVWNDAWRVTEGLIVAMRDEVGARGAKLVVVTLSNGPQVLPEPHAREAFMKRLVIDDLFYPDNRIKDLCVNERIPVITLAPDMQDYAEKSKVFLHGFGSDIGNGHWNAVGHRVAGQLIARKLCEGVAK